MAYIKINALLALIFLSVANAHVIDCGDSSLFYINGVNNPSENDAKDSARFLKRVLKNDVTTIYNRSHGLTSDVYDALRQKIDQDLSCESLLCRAIRFSGGKGININEIINQSQKYGLTSNSIVLSHSQGNFYANNLCDHTKIGGFRNIQIATPASLNKCGKRYTTLTTDEVVLSVNLAAKNLISETVNLAPMPNVVQKPGSCLRDPRSEDTSLLSVCHGMYNYLNFNKSSAKIIKDYQSEKKESLSRRSVIFNDSSIIGAKVNGVTISSNSGLYFKCNQLKEKVISKDGEILAITSKENLQVGEVLLKEVGPNQFDIRVFAVPKYLTWFHIFGSLFLMAMAIVAARLIYQAGPTILSPTYLLSVKFVFALKAIKLMIIFWILAGLFSLVYGCDVKRTGWSKEIIPHFERE